MEKMSGKGMSLMDAKSKMAGMGKMGMREEMMSKDMQAMMKECEKMMTMMGRMMEKMKGMA